MAFAGAVNGDILRLGGLWKKRQVKRFSPCPERFRIGNLVGLPKIALRGGLENRRQSGKRNAVSAPAIALPSQRVRPMWPNSGYRLERVAPAMPLVWNSECRPSTDGAGTLRPQDALDMATERQRLEGAVRNWSNAWRGRGSSGLTTLSGLKGRVRRATRTERRRPLDAGTGVTRAAPRVKRPYWRKSLPCGGSRIPCFPCIRPGDSARPDARCGDPPPTWPPWCGAGRGTPRRGRS